jgi:hypothetical protein
VHGQDAGQGARVRVIAVDAGVLKVDLVD